MNKIDIILSTPRVFFADKSETNFTVGLYDLIKEHVKNHFTMVEIGSFSGVSSELFANFVNKIYCVDVWQEYTDHGSASTLLISAKQLQTAENNFDDMMKNYQNIIKLKKTSVDASKDFENESLDMVYIDSAHDFKTVDQDIKHWYPKIKSGGIIAGHDYRIKGVNTAVKNNFDLTKTKIYNYKDSSWLVYK